MVDAASCFGTKIECELNQRYSHLFTEREDLFKLTTFKDNYELPVHSWYKYTQAYSPRLVYELIDCFKISQSDYVLDPFAGVGTTALACQDRGVPSVGFEISPLASFVANVKLKRGYDWKTLTYYLNKLKIEELKFSDYGPAKTEYGPVNISRFLPKISLDYINGLLNWLADKPEDVRSLFLVALMCSFEEISYIRKHGSHYRFMNEANAGVQRKLNFETIEPDKVFHEKIERVISDIKQGDKKQTTLDPIVPRVNNRVINCSIFELWKTEEHGFTHVITSPPYLNRNNYIAQQKPEMLLFHFLSSFKEYRDLTKRTMRSHVEAEKQHTVNYSNRWVAEILDKLSTLELSYKTVPEMIQGYFEDLYAILRMISERSVDKCKYCFVVGNSRWSGIVVPVDTLLLSIAEDLNMVPKKIMVTRYKGNSPQQMAKYGRYPLRESIVIFEGN